MDGTLTMSIFRRTWHGVHSLFIPQTPSYQLYLVPPTRLSSSLIVVSKDNGGKIKCLFILGPKL